jgi:hypothetical protein
MPGPLAQKIRAKFPGVYDDMDDAALEKAVLSRHPEYADLAEPEPAPKEEKSLGGFAVNAAKSGGRFLKSVATAPIALFEADQAIKRDPAGAVKGFWEAIGQIPAALKGRYGSLEALKNTAYEDPVGLLGDVSTVAGVGAATKIPKIAGTLGKLEAATNPMRMIGKPIEKLADKTSSAVIKGTLRPSKAIRDDFGGADAIADTVKKERVFSEASAGKKLGESSAAKRARLEQAEAAGVEGPERKAIADAARGKPSGKAAMRARLGEPDQTDVIEARAKHLEGDGGRFGLVDADVLKGEAQELAFEAGTDNLSLKKLQNKEIARAFREGIEQQVPDVGPMNERTQGLIGAKRAFSEAQDRPNALTNMMALGAGGTVGAGTGDPVQAIATALAMKAMNSPRVGALAGIGINEIGQAAINPELLRAALIARLTGQDQ